MILRHATMDDIPLLETWDREPDVIAATTDDKDAEEAFEGTTWPHEMALQSDVYRYFIAEEEGRPIGAMLMIDPHLEPTHYWGEVAPNLRALDIWIGAEEDRGRGYGRQMMRLALELCFADPKVTGVLIDPLASNVRAHRFYDRMGFRFVERRLFHEEDECFVFHLSRADWEASEAPPDV